MTYQPGTLRHPTIFGTLSCARYGRLGERYEKTVDASRRQHKKLRSPYARVTVEGLHFTGDSDNSGTKRRPERFGCCYSIALLLPD